MKISDIFRTLADAIDQEQNPGSPDPRLQNPAELVAVAAPGPYSDQVDAPQNQDAGADDEVYVPPLQLKLELLKRAVGADNIYDAGEARADDVEEPAHHDHHDHHGHTDELARMKQLAAIQTLSDDEVFDD
jgi:hypothetical protein